MGPSIVIFLGAPGAGKGTQAARLSAARSLPHVSTGDLFRENLKGNTPLGQRARSFMDSGRLVPDELVLEMLFERVARPDCERGYVLDGFPRTLPQAEAFGARLGATRPIVINVRVADAVISERITGRLTCRACGHVQHRKSSPPRKPGVCDRCQGELYQRADDAPAVVAERLRVYHDQTAPLIGYYRAQGVLRDVEGERTPDAVFADVESIVPPSEAA